jgi:hypothetical protein
VKLCTFVSAGLHAGAPRLGAVVEAGVVDLAALSDGALPDSMLAFIAAGEPALAKARGAIGQQRARPGRWTA